MKGPYFSQLASSIVTPKQIFPDCCEFNQAPQPEFKCVSYVPSQEGGLMVNENYKFSDGYSVDPQGFQHSGPVHTVVESGGLGTPFESFHGQNDQIYYSVPNSTDLNKENSRVDVNQALYAPFNGEEFDRQVIPFTPSFFASNAAFKRIPLNPGRSIFRRRKPGDCVSEWSNAFSNDFDEHQNPYCCTN